MVTSPLPQAPNNYPCWGLEYSSSDNECRNCSYQHSCRDAFIGRSSIAPPPAAGTNYMVPAPMTSFAPPPPPPPNVQGGWRSVHTQMAPPPPPPAPPTYSGWQPNSVQQAPPPPQWQQAPQSLHWQPQHQWEQIIGKYPGESTLERVSKNTFLRMLEAAFSELVRFFHYFTWPKSN